MPTNTPNIDLYKKVMTTDQTHTFNIDTMLNQNWDKIDNALGNIQTELKSNINQQTKTLTNSTPTQHITAKQNCGVDVEVGGEMVVNLLGKDGDCEDLSKFFNVGVLSLSTTRVFGEYSLRAKRLTADSRSAILMSNNIKENKYYFFSSYLAAITGEVYCRIDQRSAGGTTINPVLDTTKITDTNFTREGIKFQGYVNVDTLRINMHGANENDEGYYDGIMLNEISELEYNTLTVDQLLAKYPYTNSAQPLLNPTVELCGKNLVKNGNGENGINDWIGNLSLENNKFKVTSSGAWTCVYQVIDLKPSTSYYINGNITGANAILQVASIDGTVQLMLGKGTFNSGNYSKCHLRLVMSSTGTGYFDHIQLEQGTTSTPYEPYKGGQIIFPTELSKLNTYQDELTYKEGVAKVDRKVKHDELIGSDMSPSFSKDYTGYKRIRLSSEYGSPNYVCVKHNGKILKTDNSWDSADIFVDDGGTGRYITISDTDSGWGETYTPTVNEIKAYFNGWVMYKAEDSTQYKGTGTRAWNKRYQGIGVKQTMPFGAIVEGGTNTATLPAISAYGNNTEVYQLYYALAKPIQEEIEPIILGDGVNLAEGQNTLTVKSGVVWEKAEPKKLDTNSYCINQNTFSDTYLEYIPNSIIKILRKQGDSEYDDTFCWTIASDIYAYGGKARALLPIEVYESKDRIGSTYYVLYEVLQEDYNCQVQEAEVSYEDNIRGALNEAKEEIANNQQTISELQLTNKDTNIQGNGERIEIGEYNYSNATANTITSYQFTFKNAFKEIPSVFLNLSETGGTTKIIAHTSTSYTTRTGFTLFITNLDNVVGFGSVKYIAIGK